MVDSFEGFMPIHTLFYTVFHPTKGTQVRYEFPPGNLENHEINFDTIKNYIIPKPQLCHKLLTLKYKSYRIACYPVTINNSFYARNFFSFNFVFVFPYDCETSPYEPAIARLGKMFRVLEEQNQILSKAEKDPIYFDYKLAENNTDQEGKLGSEKGYKGVKKNQGFALEKYNEIMEDLKSSRSEFSVQDLVMRIFQDLNNYSECLIPIDEGNAVDIKIFPLKTPPNSCISIEDVPISTVNLKKVIDVNWDPTMLKIVPYVDGLNSISKIAKLSDSDLTLVVECIKHLIYYNCVILADIFQFSNIYAPTSLIRTFLTDAHLASQCQSYVTLSGCSSLCHLPFERYNKFELDDQAHIQESESRTTSMSSKSDRQRLQFTDLSQKNLYNRVQRSQSSFSSTNTNTSNPFSKHLPMKASLFDLYRSLSQGVTIREWYKQHYHTIKNNEIDVRRFIKFGVVKGLIYRCYSFPIMKKLAIFELAHNLSATEDINDRIKNPRGDKNHRTLQHIFSTSDMKFGMGEHGSKNSEAHQNFNVDIADEVLRNVYHKLSFDGELEVKQDNPISRLYKEDSHVSLSDFSGDNVSHPRKPERASKVSFDMKGGDSAPLSKKGKHDEKEAAKIFNEKRNEKLILLESIGAAESLDKICVKLEKPKHEVEELLDELGDYKIINS